MSAEYNPAEFTGVPEGWDCKRLLDCTSDQTISYGIVQPGQHKDDGVPVIRVNNFNNGQLDLNDVLRVAPEVEDKYKRTRLKGGEVLLTLVGSTGQSVIVPKELIGWNVPRAIAVIRPTPEVGSEWINICLQSTETKHFLDVRANTTVQKTLNLKDVRDIPILLPPERTRRAIESIATTLTRKIQLNNQINQTLEQMAQAIFKSWFVDFEPVKAKIAARKGWQALQLGNEPASPVCYAGEIDGQFVDVDCETYMNLAAMQAISGKDAEQLAQMAAEQPEQYAELQATAALFPAAMQASELGEIPEGWSTLSLDTVAKYQNGLALQKFRPENDDDFLPVVKIAQLKKGYADGEEKASPNIKPECIIDNGDVVFSWSGSLVVDIWCGGKAALNQHLFKVTSKHYPKWLYYYYTKHHLEEFQRIAAAKAVTMGHIKREHLKQAQCVVPKTPLLEACSAYIGDMLAKQIVIRLESQALAQTRDLLLPKLLSGELTLPEAEAELQEVAHA